MKKNMVALGLMLSLFSAGAALAADGEWTIKTENTVNGTVTADGPDSEANIGGVKAGNAGVGAVDIDIINSNVGDIEARDGGVVNYGSVNMRNATADSVTVKGNNNSITGKVTAKGAGAKASIGSVDMEGATAKTIDMQENVNTGTGNITADGAGSTVTVGSVNASDNNDGSSVIMKGNTNNINGAVDALDGGTAHIGSVNLKGGNSGKFTLGSMTNNVTAGGSVTATGAGSTVMVGTIDAKDSSGEVTLGGLNTINKAVRAESGGEVLIGSAKLSNFSKKVTMTTTNTINGTMTASSKGKINVGSLTD
ncbi:MAG: hypothetical protein LBU39_06465 [Desulfobulbaceae bacterium]|jgi:autotransporter family porin|nr:hypothetical protein [Desulfobulbaceae bacterium]